MKRLLPLLLLLLLGGCGGDSRIVGVWKVDIAKTKIPPIPMPELQEQVQAGLANFLLKVRTDHTYYLSSGPASSEGNWTLEGDTIKFQSKDTRNSSAAVQSLDKMTGRLLPDQTFTIEEPTPLGSVVIALKKVA